MDERRHPHIRLLPPPLPRQREAPEPPVAPEPLLTPGFVVGIVSGYLIYWWFIAPLLGIR